MYLFSQLTVRGWPFIITITTGLPVACNACINFNWRPGKFNPVLERLSPTLSASSPTTAITTSDRLASATAESIEACSCTCKRCFNDLALRPCSVNYIAAFYITYCGLPLAHIGCYSFQYICNRVMRRAIPAGCIIYFCCQRAGNQYCLVLTCFYQGEAGYVFVF